MNGPCFECVKAGGGCCLIRQIVITEKDIERVAACLGRSDFYSFEFPEDWYLEPCYDPDWLPLVLRPDGRLKILKRKEDRSCGLLGENGCVLPFHVRPRLCQLHPYLHTEAGIIGLDQACLISHVHDVVAYLEDNDMPLEKAVEWQEELYFELKKEKQQLLDIRRHFDGKSTRYQERR